MWPHQGCRIGRPEIRSRFVTASAKPSSAYGLAGSVRAGQLPVTSGLAWTFEMMVPPYLAVSGTPYWASLPNFLVVTPGIALPKFQMQSGAEKSGPIPWPALSVKVQNG